MARYRRRRYYRKNKFNVETRPISFTTPSTQQNGFYQNQTPIVPPSTTEGVRKVGKFTLSLETGGGVLYWALVYIPEGATTTALFPSSTELFVPSSYVLSSGVASSNTGVTRISSRLWKNLNAGDQIFLLTANNTAGVSIRGLSRYVIAFN